MISFILNDRLVRTEERPGMVLLEFIRNVSCLSGTKDACREGECGACTVLLGSPEPDGSVSYAACASCLLPLGEADGRHVVTVEGLSVEPLTLVQRLIVEHGASQCGFCTPGIVLSLTGFALSSPSLSYEDAVTALDGNICRCTGYVSIRSAAGALCEAISGAGKPPAGRLDFMIKAGVAPEYFRGIPARLGELEASPDLPDGKAVPVAGGTDLFAREPERLLESGLRFLSRRRDLAGIREDRGFLRAGGAVTIEAFRNSAAVLRHFPALAQDLLLHSSAILRNKATLAGNIANASPVGDAAIILLALGARLTISGEAGEREIPLEKFYLGYKRTDLACGELISAISIPLPPSGARYHFEKVSNRVTLDIAAANSALFLTTGPGGTVSGLRVSAGGVAPVPMLVPGLDVFLGRSPGDALAEDLAAAAMAAAKPIDDVRGSAEYKKLLLGRLILAHFRALYPGEAA